MVWSYTLISNEAPLHPLLFYRVTGCLGKETIIITNHLLSQQVWLSVEAIKVLVTSTLSVQPLAFNLISPDSSLPTLHRMSPFHLQLIRGHLMSVCHHLPAHLGMNPVFFFILLLIDWALTWGGVNNLQPVLLRCWRAPDFWLHNTAQRTPPVSHLPN